MLNVQSTQHHKTYKYLLLFKSSYFLACLLFGVALTFLACTASYNDMEVKIPLFQCFYHMCLPYSYLNCTLCRAFSISSSYVNILHLHTQPSRIPLCFSILLQWDFVLSFIIICKRHFSTPNIDLEFGIFSIPNPKLNSPWIISSISLLPFLMPIMCLQ